MPGSVFLDFVGFTLSGFWRAGAYFLFFGLLHSLSFGLREWKLSVLKNTLPSLTFARALFEDS